MSALETKRHPGRPKGTAHRVCCGFCERTPEAVIQTIPLCHAHLTRAAEIADTTPDALLALYPLRRHTNVRHRAPRTERRADSAAIASDVPLLRLARSLPLAHATTCERCHEQFETCAYVTKHCPRCRIIVKRENRRLSKRRVTARRKARAQEHAA